MPQLVYKFERWTLDCGRGTLHSASGSNTLRPKSFEVLRFLIENAERLVTREELLAAVWPGLTVTEESLTQCVSEIRNALGEAGQRIIKTVPKRGYLFGVLVDGQDARAKDQPTLLQGPSIAVLPFANLSGDTAQEYLSDGITEDIISGLSYFSDLSVIARNSSFSYKGRAIDVREVGRQLGVGYVVEGSVRRFGDRIRITAQLVDTVSGVRRWSERFDRAVGDVFAIQDEITQAVVRIVVAHLGHAEAQRVSRKPASSWTAYDLMLQGDQAQRNLEQSWDTRYLFEAQRIFAEAYKIDPNNAAICAKLGHTHVRAFADPASPNFTNAGEIEHGYELARKAVRLDPNLPVAHAQLGWAHFWMKQLDPAVEEFEKAVAFNPNFTDYRYPAVLVFAGQPLRALDVIQTHVRLDPFHPTHLLSIQGHALYVLRRYGEAEKPLRECIGRGPQFILGQVWLAATLVRLNKLQEARIVAAAVLERLPNLSLEQWPMFSVYRDLQDMQDMLEALREAGFS